MTPLTKGLMGLVGLPILLSLIFFYYFISTGEERMRQTCALIEPGMSFDAVSEFAKERNLTTPDRGNQVTFLAERRNLGRHACKVTVDAGVVSQSEYSHAD